jgi:hypothetical protein
MKLLAFSKYCSTLAKLYGEGNYNLKKVMLFENVPYMNNITTFPKQHKMTFPIEHYLLDASQPMFLDHSLNMRHVVQQNIVYLQNNCLAKAWVQSKSFMKIGYICKILNLHNNFGRSHNE